MKYFKFTALLCIAMVLLVAVSACAAPATPAPTVAPTAAPKPTDVPKPTEAPKPTVAPTTAPTVAPTVVPTVAPTVAATKPVTATTPTTPTASSAVPTGAAAALAAKKSGAEVFSDSFEKGTAGAFIDWNILDKDAHVATKSGITIVEPPVKAPDGKLAAKMFSNTAVDAQANKDFADLAQGRLTFLGMVPTTDPGFVGVELRNAGKRIFSIEMHPEGRFRYRDDAGALQESKVNYTFDKWYPITLEWDATANIWNAWTVDDSGKTVLLTPPAGAQFAKETPGASPNRVQLRLNKATPGKVGYVDNLKIVKVE